MHSLVMFISFVVLYGLIVFQHADSNETDEVYVKYNEIAHYFHSLRREMLVKFKDVNVTAGEIILNRVESILKGFREFKDYADLCADNMFKRVEPIFRFIVLRGRTQFALIKYTDFDLQKKYGWEEEHVFRFREACKEINTVVEEFLAELKERNVSLDD